MDTVTPLILIGPSGAGKSTVARLLEDTGDYEIIRSYTTRARRPNEDDVTHYFVSGEEFDQLIATGKLMGHAEVFGNRYGLPRIAPSVRRPLIILRAPQIPYFQKAFPSCVIVQLTAPVPLLMQRISERGDRERLSQEDFEAEITLGQTYAKLVIDTSEPIDNCVEQINLLFSRKHE